MAGGGSSNNKREGGPGAGGDGGEGWGCHPANPSPFPHLSLMPRLVLSCQGGLLGPPLLLPCDLRGGEN